jgi:hypothetical protein
MVAVVQTPRTMLMRSGSMLRREYPRQLVQRLIEYVRTFAT